MNRLTSILLLCTVLIFSGCGKDSGEEPFLEVTPAKVTFSRTIQSQNLITVKCNNSWSIQVGSPELVLDKTNGSAGENIVTVLSIPDGKSIMMTVSSGGLQKWVSVTASGGGVPSLEVSPASIDFDPAKPAWNVITVHSDVAWKAVVSNPEVKIAPTEGVGGSERISVTDMPYGVTATVTVTTARTDGGEDVSKTVTVSRRPQYAWVELPAQVDNPDYVYIKHFAKTVKSKKDVRNYTTCYDASRHVPRYVAYPMHGCYQEGGFGRTTPDPWRPDPAMTEAQQSIIYDREDWQNWPWSNNPTPGRSKSDLTLWTRCNGVYFNRGHMMASAHRGGAGAELNVQTFYPSNIAPENMMYYAHWELIEKSISSNWICNDTLYVVQGTWFENDDNTVYDAGNYNRTSPGVSKICVVPTHRFTLLLRTKSGSTGKHVAECGADELTAIGFWLPQNFDSESPAAVPSIGEYTCSVAEIERRIGGEFDFFPLCPDAVKERFDVSDWAGLQDAM